MFNVIINFIFRPGTDPMIPYKFTHSDSEDGQSCNDQSEHPSKVVINTGNAIIPRLKDFHGLLIDPPYVSFLV